MTEHYYNRIIDSELAEYGIRTSLENFSEYDKIKVYPLYAIGNINKICTSRVI